MANSGRMARILTMVVRYPGRERERRSASMNQVFGIVKLLIVLFVGCLLSNLRHRNHMEGLSASVPASKRNADVSDALGDSKTAHSTSIVKSIAMRTPALFWGSPVGDGQPRRADAWE